MWRRRGFALGVGVALAGAAALGAAIVLSGVYNVAASVEHIPITDRLLKLVLRRSVDTHSAGIEVPELDDPGLVRLGARHFAAGCEPCHAGPGHRPEPGRRRHVSGPPGARRPGRGLGGERAVLDRAPRLQVHRHAAMARRRPG